MNKNTEENQVRNQELMRNIEQVRAKNEETTIVRTKIIDCSAEIKVKIQNKFQKLDNISTEDLLRYKAMIQTLSQEKERILNEHQGKVQEQVALLSKARLEGNVEAANTAIMNIRAQQQLRLDELTKVLKLLESFEC